MDDVSIAGERLVVPIDKIKPNRFNYNRQDDARFKKLIASMRRFGFVDPLICRSVRGGYEIINGEHRWRAARELGMAEAPIRNLGKVPTPVAKKLCIILNELKGSPDEVALAELLDDLTKAVPSAELLEVLPYDSNELDMYLGSINFSFEDIAEVNRETEIAIMANNFAPEPDKEPKAPSPAKNKPKAPSKAAAADHKRSAAAESEEASVAIVGEEIVVPTKHVRPNKFNYNRESDRIYGKVLASIRRLGFVDPPVCRQVKRRYEIINGEHRVRAAVELGLEEIPITNLGEVSDEVAKQLCIILNELKGTPDTVQLAVLLRSLNVGSVQDELLELMPYSEGELDMYLNAVDFSFEHLPTTNARKVRVTKQTRKDGESK